MRNLLLWMSLIGSVLAGEVGIPSNNNWSGFSVGSWIEVERFQTSGAEPKKVSREKMILFSFDPAGPAELESFAFEDGKWVRHEFSSNSMSGNIVSLDGMVPLPDRDKEKIIASKDGVNTYTESAGWKMESLPDETLEIDGRKLVCKIRQWTSAGDKRTQVLKGWFNETVSVPQHLESFGPYQLTVCTTPNILKLEWSLNGAKPMVASALSLNEKVTVDGAAIECVKWRSGARGGTMTSWFSDAVPGRTVKYESVEGATEFGETLQRFRKFEKPLSPKDVKPIPSAWSDFAVGSWVEHTESSTRKDSPAERHIRTKLLGFTEDGYPYLESTHVAGPYQGRVINALEIPMSTIEGKRVTLKNKRPFAYKHIVPLVFACDAYEFDCKDQWKRSWNAGLVKQNGENLPLRHLRSWFVTATLDPETLLVIAEVSGQTLVRQVVSKDDVVAIGDRKIRCVKETESLESPRVHRKGLYRTSREVPGHTVSYALDDEDGKDAYQIVDFKSEPKS